MITRYFFFVDFFTWQDFKWYLESRVVHVNSVSSRICGSLSVKWDFTESRHHTVTVLVAFYVFYCSGWSTAKCEYSFVVCF